MSTDPCLSIFISQELLQDPCLRSMSEHPSRFAPCSGKQKFWPLEIRFCVGFCAGKTIRILTFQDVFLWPCAAKRQFNLPRRVLCPLWKITRSYQDAKKFSQQLFCASETQIFTSGVAFLVALRNEKRADRKVASRPKRLYSYRKNP